MVFSQPGPFFLSALLFVSALGRGSLVRADPELFDPTKVIQLTWNPRAFLYKGFLSDEECEHLIALAKDKLEISMVADNDSGKSVMSEVRTSSGMFLEKHQDEVVGRIEKRIAAWTFLPEENGESIQILHYENGQKYEPHYDYFHDKNNQALGGHRIATVLMYLSNVIKGGETIFPNSQAKLIQEKDDTWSDCAKNGYAVKPEKGDALLFFSLHLDATTDPKSLHGSCPVIEGEKWSATKWIHVRSFDKPDRRSLGGDCVDENEFCSKWAALGECIKNPLYMVLGGKARRKKLLSPKGMDVRPMMEVVRGAAFDILQVAGGCPASLRPGRWLDLYSGTGSVGIEAISRGCSEAHFVEMDPWVVSDVLRPNLEWTGFLDVSVIHTLRVENFLERAEMSLGKGGPFDYVSVTPPYTAVNYSTLMEQLAKCPLVGEDCFILVEYPLKTSMAESCGHLVKIVDRRFGRTNLLIYGPTWAQKKRKSDKLLPA